MQPFVLDKSAKKKRKSRASPIPLRSGGGEITLHPNASYLGMPAGQAFMAFPHLTSQHVQQSGLIFSAPVLEEVEDSAPPLPVDEEER